MITAGFANKGLEANEDSADVLQGNKCTLGTE